MRLRLPIRIAQDHNRGRTWLSIAAIEEPAPGGNDPEIGEIVTRHEVRADRRIAFDNYVKVLLTYQSQLRRTESPGAPLFGDMRELEKRGGIPKMEPVQDHRIENLEFRKIYANTEREDHNRASNAYISLEICGCQE